MSELEHWSRRWRHLVSEKKLKIENLTLVQRKDRPERISVARFDIFIDFKMAEIKYKNSFLIFWVEILPKLTFLSWKTLFKTT